MFGAVSLVCRRHTDAIKHLLNNCERVARAALLAVTGLNAGVGSALRRSERTPPGETKGGSVTPRHGADDQPVRRSLARGSADAVRVADGRQPRALRNR